MKLIYEIQLTIYLYQSFQVKIEFSGGKVNVGLGKDLCNFRLSWAEVVRLYMRIINNEDYYRCF